MASENVPVARRKKRRLEEIDEDELDDDDNKNNHNNSNTTTGSSPPPFKKQKQMNDSNAISVPPQYQMLLILTIPKLKQLTKAILNGSSSNLVKFAKNMKKPSQRTATAPTDTALYPQKAQIINKLERYTSIVPEINALIDKPEMVHNQEFMNKLNPKINTIKTKLIEECKKKLFEQIGEENKQNKMEENKCDGVIFLDFDDTIFPSKMYKDYINYKRTMPSSSNRDKRMEKLKPKCNEIMEEFSNLIKSFKQKFNEPDIVIITNAKQAWFDEIFNDDNYPNYGELLKKTLKIPIISANDLFSKVLPRQYTKWKKYAFETYLEFKKYANPFIISIGDGPSEYFGIVESTENIKQQTLIRFVFKVNPTETQQIASQLHYLSGLVSYIDKDCDPIIVVRYHERYEMEQKYIKSNQDDKDQIWIPYKPPSKQLYIGSVEYEMFLLSTTKGVVIKKNNVIYEILEQKMESLPPKFCGLITCKRAFGGHGMVTIDVYNEKIFILGSNGLFVKFIGKMMLCCSFCGKIFGDKFKVTEHEKNDHILECVPIKGGTMKTKKEEKPKQEIKEDETEEALNNECCTMDRHCLFYEEFEYDIDRNEYIVFENEYESEIECKFEEIKEERIYFKRENAIEWNGADCTKIEVIDIEEDEVRLEIPDDINDEYMIQVQYEGNIETFQVSSYETLRDLRDRINCRDDMEMSASHYFSLPRDDEDDDDDSNYDEDEDEYSLKRSGRLLSDETAVISSNYNGLTLSIYWKSFDLSIVDGMDLSLSVRVSSDWTIKKLKDSVVRNHSVRLQCLSHSGMELVDDQQLNYYEINKSGFTLISRISISIEDHSCMISTDLLICDFWDFEKVLTTYLDAERRESHQNASFYYLGHKIPLNEHVYTHQLTNRSKLEYKVDSYPINIYDSEQALRANNDDLAAFNLMVWDHWTLNEVKKEYSSKTKKPFMEKEKFLSQERELEDNVPLWKLRIRDNEKLIIEREQQEIIVAYICCECGSKVNLRRYDSVQCRQCFHGAVYKQRTARVCQYSCR